MGVGMGTGRGQVSGPWHLSPGSFTNRRVDLQVLGEVFRKFLKMYCEELSLSGIYLRHSFFLVKKNYSYTTLTRKKRSLSIYLSSIDRFFSKLHLYRTFLWLSHDMYYVYFIKICCHWARLEDELHRKSF